MTGVSLVEFVRGGLDRFPFRSRVALPTQSPLSLLLRYPYLPRLLFLSGSLGISGRPFLPPLLVHFGLVCAVLLQQDDTVPVLFPLMWPLARVIHKGPSPLRRRCRYSRREDVESVAFGAV